MLGTRVKPILEFGGQGHSVTVTLAKPVETQEQIAQRKADERKQRIELRDKRNEQYRQREAERNALVVAAVAPVVAPAAVPVNRDREDAFWEAITRLNWTNRSDGVVPRNVVEGVIASWSAETAAAFAGIYKRVYRDLHLRMVADGILQRNGIVDIADVSCVISHIIALGKNVYLNLLEDMEMCDFIISAGECQSLHAMLPRDWQ